MKNKRGITLIALVVTIIITLIIAGVSISVLVGEQGIINKSIIAKKQAIISNEKEILHLSTKSAISKNRNLKLEQDKLESALIYNMGNKDKTFEIIEYDNHENIKFFVVKFLDSKNVYMVEDSKEAEWIGNLNETEEVVVPKNLLYGLEDTDPEQPIHSWQMNYFIQNSVFTVTAEKDDGWGPTEVKAYLEKNKTYLFKCDTNGKWGGGKGTDTVEAFLILNKNSGTGYYERMKKDDNYKFSLSTMESGVHYLRLDVNQNRKTYTFSNISVKLIVD